MAVNKRYYWLKLKEDFFDDDTIQFIEEQPNGKEYCLFYLKLCLKSLKRDGVLIRRVGDILIPYDVKKLSEITRTNVDTVKTAMQLFKQIGLIQVLENGELYLTQLNNMIGTETKDAIRKRKKRAEIKGVENVRSLSENCPPEIEKEKEKDKELDIEKDKDNVNNSCSCNGEVKAEIIKYMLDRGFTYPSPIQIDKILADIEIYNIDEVKKSIDIADNNGKHTYSYVKGILERRKADGGPQGSYKKKPYIKQTAFNNFEPRKQSDRYNYLQEQCLLGQATEEEKEEFRKLRGDD